MSGAAVFAVPGASAGTGVGGVHGEGGGADRTFMLEVEEEPVGAVAGGGGHEGDVGAGSGGAVAGLALGVYVEVGEVSGARAMRWP